jgi:transposase
MLIVETIAKIRRYHFVEGKKIKQIVRDLRISRNTVRKVLRSGATEHHYERDTQPVPKLGPFAERLEALLEEDAKRPRNRRMTAQRLFEVLQSEGYQGTYDSVQRTVKKWHQQRGRAAEQIFIPLTFAPGEAYQFDWSHEKVILADMIQIVKVAHFRLCHSRMFSLSPILGKARRWSLIPTTKPLRFSAVPAGEASMTISRPRWTGCCSASSASSTSGSCTCAAIIWLSRLLYAGGGLEEGSD